MWNKSSGLNTFRRHCICQELVLLAIGQATVINHIAYLGYNQVLLKSVHRCVLSDHSLITPMCFMLSLRPKYFVPDPKITHAVAKEDEGRVYRPALLIIHSTLYASGQAFQGSAQISVVLHLQILCNVSYPIRLKIAAMLFYRLYMNKVQATNQSLVILCCVMVQLIGSQHHYYFLTRQVS